MFYDLLCLAGIFVRLVIWRELVVYFYVTSHHLHPLGKSNNMQEWRTEEGQGGFNPGERGTLSCPLDLRF